MQIFLFLKLSFYDFFNFFFFLNKITPKMRRVDHFVCDYRLWLLDLL